MGGCERTLVSNLLSLVLHWSHSLALVVGGPGGLAPPLLVVTQVRHDNVSS